MFPRKSFRLLCLLLSLLQGLPAFAMQNQPQSPSALSAAAQKVAEQVQKVPLGGKLTVRKLDGTEYHGHLEAIAAQDFTFTEVDLKQTFTLSYDEVAQVRKNYGGKGIGGKRVNPRNSLIVGAALGAVLVALIVAAARDKS